MTEIEIDTFLLSLNGVTRFDIAAMGLRRYLVHDLPFVVAADGSAGIINIKLSRAKMRELSARFPDAVSEPALYDPSAWIALNPVILSDAAVRDTLFYAYMRLLNQLSALSRAIYLEKKPDKYDFDAKQILTGAVIRFKTDPKKRIVDLSDV